MRSSVAWISVAMVPGLIGLLLLRSSVADEPADSRDPAKSAAEGHDEAAPAREEISRVSLEVARDRAQLLHNVYASTLDVMHQRYFHRERAVVPARAMEDVFEDMQRQSQIEARWIAVSLKAMSINHEPKTEFEKRSAHEIKAGEHEVEVVEDGYYRRAVAIPLTEGCVSCHEGFVRQPSRSAKFAGLVISIPIRDVDVLTPAQEGK